MSDPAHTTRLILKPGMPRTGAVDGAWWPGSRDLVAEVPALVGSFPTTAGRVQRVGFGRSLWDAVPHRTRAWVDGRRIGLDGFAAFAADVVWVATSITGSAPLFLLVVPPDTDAGRGRRDPAAGRVGRQPRDPRRAPGRLLTGSGHRIPG